MAKGLTQVPGVNFRETYTPVTQLESICTVLHIGATNDWDIDHIDIKMAFLHGELDEEIYMKNLKVLRNWERRVGYDASTRASTGFSKPASNGQRSYTTAS